MYLGNNNSVDGNDKNRMSKFISNCAKSIIAENENNNSEEICADYHGKNRV